jgi:hypothetical protein
MSARPLTADDIMALLDQYDPISVQAHTTTYGILARLYGTGDDTVSLVVVLRGNDKIPRSVQGRIGSAVLEIVRRDAREHFGPSVNDQTTFVSAILARALRQPSWGAVGNRVYRRTRERLLADRTLAESADKRMTDER